MAAASAAGGDPMRAEDYASEALALGVCPKGLFRRAVARRLVFDFEGAYADLVAAMELREGVSREEEDELRFEMRRLHRDAHAYEARCAVLW